MLNAAIIGGTGYTGKYLIQYCNQHQFIDELHIYANTTAGKNLFDIFPELVNEVDDIIIESADEISNEHDVYFVALPHGKSIEVITELIKSDKLIIDLGGDFRLDSNELYNQWYGFHHQDETILQNKLYGLAEFADYSRGLKLIANPGCYPTAALLSLIPIVKSFGNEIISISVNSYSGTSGAGKKADPNLLMSEMDGNVKAYNVNKHRHQPEILQELVKKGNVNSFSFTTHLLPISRGIYSSSSIHLSKSINEDFVMNSFFESYNNSEFIRIRETPPSLNWVVNTNYCDLSISVKDNIIIVNSTIDNLIKGASGQAIQNMNNYFGWNESLGIKKSQKSVINS